MLTRYAVAGEDGDAHQVSLSPSTTDTADRSVQLDVNNNSCACSCRLSIINQGCKKIVLVIIILLCRPTCTYYFARLQLEAILYALQLRQ